MLLRYSDNRREGAMNKRHDIIRKLRRIYAETLAADPEAGRMFDHFKAIQYYDFVKFGRLPRSSDGLVRPLADPHLLGTDELDFVIFSSYRWINQNPHRDSPDDANNRQYRRMIEAVESYLEFGGPARSRDRIYIWMVCVTPSSLSCR